MAWRTDYGSIIRTDYRGSNPNLKPNAYEEAKKWIDWNASDLKVSNNAVGQAMHDGIPNDINCANFVSGVLQATGQIKASQHSDGAVTLSNNLNHDPNWESVSSLKDAKPGDVVLMKTGSGSNDYHIVMFAGWKDGKVGGSPLFIGSNNVNGDGTQRITVEGMNYQIAAIHHYKNAAESPGATAIAGKGAHYGGGVNPVVGGSGDIADSGGGGEGGGADSVGSRSGSSGADPANNTSPAGKAANGSSPPSSGLDSSLLLALLSLLGTAGFNQDDLQDQLSKLFPKADPKALAALAKLLKNHPELAKRVAADKSGNLLKALASQPPEKLAAASAALDASPALSKAIAADKSGALIQKLVENPTVAKDVAANPNDSQVLTKALKTLGVSDKDISNFLPASKQVVNIQGGNVDPPNASTTQVDSKLVDQASTQKTLATAGSRA